MAAGARGVGGKTADKDAQRRAGRADPVACPARNDRQAAGDNVDGTRIRGDVAQATGGGGERYVAAAGIERPGTEADLTVASARRQLQVGRVQVAGNIGSDGEVAGRGISD